MHFRIWQNRTLGKVIILASIALIIALGLQQVKSHNDIINLISPKVSVADSKTYKQNTILGSKNVSIGGGGYVTGIYIHPKERDLVYIKTDIGGFYRWNSALKSWIPITEQFSLAQNNYYGGEALALDPKNPNIVYIAAGKYSSDWWQYKGTIFKSIDRGKTWTKLNLDLKMGGNEDMRWAGERLVIDPSNSQALFFGSRQDGLWKSLDGGKTWAKVQSFPGKLKKGIGITAVVFSKYQSGTVYAVAYEDGIYKSTDTGMSWTKLANSPSKVNRIAIAPGANRNEPIASSEILYVTHSSGVSQLRNGTWNNITPFNSKLIFNGITINPNNSKEILVSTFVDKKTQIYHSLDGGKVWNEQKRKANNTVPWWNEDMISHGSVAALEFDPKVASRVWLTDWYGIWQTENVNAKPVVWTNYQKGHEEVVSFTLVSPPSGALLLSGVADVDGFYHNQGLDTYPSKTFGARGPAFQDTYSIAYSEANPKRMARVGGNRFNNTYSGATSDDGGLTWKQFGSFPNKIPTRIAISATNPNLMLVTVSNDRALRTTDGGNSWKQISGLPNGFSGPWNWLQPLVADPVNGMTFYYYDNGKLYRSTNGGASFDIVSTSIPHGNWHSLKASPGVKGELWLGMDEQGLYHSTNGGQTFSQIPVVKKAHLFALGKPQPGKSVSALYLYGEIDKMGQGIFYSLNRGKTWKRIGDRTKPIGNDPNIMEASRQEFGLVFIATNGRGIYYGSR